MLRFLCENCVIREHILPLSRLAMLLLSLCLPKTRSYGLWAERRILSYVGGVVQNVGKERRRKKKAQKDQPKEKKKPSIKHCVT